MSLVTRRISLNRHLCCSQPRSLTLVKNRRFFSSELEAAKEGSVATETVVPVLRHGSGDGVIKLNVGGKEFITLRSTIQINKVLNERVAQAEANQEFTKGAVFIDRDPANFSLILQHLRNRADMMQNQRSLLVKRMFFSSKSTVLIQLPKDSAALRDLYVEARYFQIRELESLICSVDWYSQIANWFGSGAANPFYAASQVIANIRRALLASGGVGIFLGSQNEDLVNNVRGLANDLWLLVRGESLQGQDQAKAADSKAASSGSKAPPALA